MAEHTQGIQEIHNLFFDPANEELLNECVGFSVEDAFPYVPEAYRVKDDAGEYKVDKRYWPIFTLKSKDGVQLAKIEDKAGYVTTGEKDNQNKFFASSGTTRLTTLEDGIVEVKNFPVNVDGEICIVNFNKKSKDLTIAKRDGTKKMLNNRLPKDVIKFFKVKLQQELQNVINERKVLTAEEKRGLEF